MLLVIFLPMPTNRKHLHREKHYQDEWCFERGGKGEFISPDQTRCDCLAEVHAI